MKFYLNDNIYIENDIFYDNDNKIVQIKERNWHIYLSRLWME